MHLYILEFRFVLPQVLNALLILKHILAKFNNLIEETLFPTSLHLPCILRLWLARRVQLASGESLRVLSFFTAHLILISFVLRVNAGCDISFDSADHARSKLFKLLKNHFLGLKNVLGHLNTQSVNLLSLFEVSLILLKVQCIGYIVVGFCQADPFGSHELVDYLCVTYKSSEFNPHYQIVVETTDSLTLMEASVLCYDLEFLQKWLRWRLPWGHLRLYLVYFSF